ncbi:hypothetical protein WA026_022349 [Henosepilachna vigintioctopunctata]|uniref:Uncharacterized protein n=1 Tax=Henosepilachna vigintioctopunctata TaxID=420089 RepID=A0AAW1UVF5_9CUCU
MGRYLADVEDIISDQPEEAKDILRARFTNNITNYLQFTKTTGVLTHHQMMYKKTRKFLKENPKMYIVRADKGGCTVAMDKEKYIADTQGLLNDSTIYKWLKSDLTTKTQHSLTIIKCDKNEYLIDEITAKSLTIYSSTMSKLY